jgi:ABC-type multidrug transport system ATPase subunit
LILKLTNTGKRYNHEWIFRHVDYSFEQGETYAITGINGSGKSTLLQIIGGAVMHSEGSITINDPQVTPENLYSHLSFAAPYLDLVEELTATEFLYFHHKFKPLTATVPEILSVVSLQAAAGKQIRYFSSGMKQRLKLAQAFFSDTRLLLLDEPVTNLDAAGITLYHGLINDHAKGKLVIVSSNDPQEYDFCKNVIAIGDYK